MDTKLKQRMIGAVVLTALAIIILPMLLDGSAEDRARTISAIPEPPRIELKPLTVQQIDQKMVEMETESAAQLPPAIVTREEPEDVSDTPASDADELALDDNQLPVSWSLQLASFKNQENALNLRQSLRDAEFRTYIIKAPTDEGDVYRVFVGPMLQKSRLAAIGQELETKFELKGRIVRYRIEDDKGQLGG